MNQLRKTGEKIVRYNPPNKNPIWNTNGRRGDAFPLPSGLQGIATYIQFCNQSVGHSLKLEGSDDKI